MTEVTQEDREAFKAFRELLFKPRVGEDGFCLMDIEAGLQWVASHRIAAIEATKEACTDVADERAKHIEILMLSDEKGVTDSRVAFQMACQLVAKDIRALTATDIMKGVGR